jgi:ubiquinone/menaquinone biosynthesis C-methylase UbiE
LAESKRNITYACPRCRASIELGAKAEGRRCLACGLELRDVSGIISFVACANVNEWQAFFQDRSVAQDRNTSAANDYRSALQQRYIVDGFRRACGTLPDDAHILDVGCGNGLFWAALSGKPNVLGVDYSLGMCALARSRGMHVYHADAMALPFADEQFDLIYSAEVLQCISDHGALMAELARVCRTSGRIVVSTLNRMSWLRRTMRQVRKLVPHAGVPPHTPAILRTAAELAAVGRTCSLSIRSVWWVHFPFPCLLRTATEKYALEAAASNMIIEFVKPMPVARSVP